jgi:hypothetical protein
VPINDIAQAAIIVKVKNVSSKLLFVAVPSEGIVGVITRIESCSSKRRISEITHAKYMT